MVQENLHKLSKKQLIKLANIAGIGFLNPEKELDKEEIILILSTENKKKINSALKKMKI